MSDFKESLKVNNSKMQRVKTSAELLTEREARRTYERFVAEQEEQFLLFINYLNKYINGLRDKGIISQFLEFRARIKATNSALKNYEKKALDDVFGLEFICATEREIEVITRELEGILKVHKEKRHNKDNGYKALHHSCSMSKDVVEKLNEIARAKGIQQKEVDLFPTVEVQYKTVEVFYQAIYGTASHEKYKGVQLPQLQQLYNSNSLTVGEYIPYMWISDPENDNMRELSTEEVLKKMYPSLKLNGKSTEDREER